MELDLRDLRFFRTIAELEHLGRAGDALGRSQPALTKCVRRLETAVGAELFERRGRGIALTPVGEMLLAESRRLLNAADSTFEEVERFARGEAGCVRLGCGPISAEHLLPGICELVLAHAGGVTLQITIAMNYALREQLRRGEIELIAGMVEENDTEFCTTPLVDDTVVVAAGRSHPIFQHPAPSLADLTAYDWVLPVTHVASRRWLDRLFASHALPAPRVRIEANSLPMPQAMVARTGLLCFVSRHLLSDDAQSPLREVSIPEATLHRRAGLTYPAEHLPPSVRRVIDLLSDNRSRIAAPTRG